MPTMNADIIYSKNLQTNDHVLKGPEGALRDWVDEIGFSIDEEPTRHVVTKQIIEGASKCVFNAGGEHCGFLLKDKDADESDGWMLVFRASEVLSGELAC